MTDKVEIEECNCDAKEMDHAECPEDQKVDGKCPEKKAAPATESIPSWVKDLQTSYASLSGKLEKLTALEQSAGVREAPKPTAQVNNSSSDTVTMENIAEKLSKALSEGRDLKLEIPYDEVRAMSVSTAQVGRNGIKESYKASNARKHQIEEVGFTYTGTLTAIDQIPGVQTVPGGVDYAPLRQYTNYKVIPKGRDSGTFYKKTLPDTLIQAPGTTVTESSMTFTAINIATPSITGSYFKIDSDDEENYPINIAAETVDAISQTVVEYENTAIADTAAAAATPGLWVNGNTGATITHDDIAGMTLDPSAIGKAMAYLRTQGYLKGGVKPVLFAHPNAVDQLIRDSDLTNFTQFSNDGITRDGIFPTLFGCDIVATTSLTAVDNTTNDTYRNYMCIPGITFGSISKRVLNVQYHSIPEANQVGVTANWRFKAGVIDASSLVRISTAQ